MYLTNMTKYRIDIGAVSPFEAAGLIADMAVAFRKRSGEELLTLTEHNAEARTTLAVKELDRRRAGVLCPTCKVEMCYVSMGSARVPSTPGSHQPVICEKCGLRDRKIITN